MAGAQAITDKYIRTRVATKRTIKKTDLSTLHQTLMENMLYGFDVLPSAVHLTAASLGMLAPDVICRQMQLFVMPLGMEGKTARLGSLDFIGRQRLQVQFSLDDTHMEVKQTGVIREQYAIAEVPKMDLCVMNPPFTRSVGGNLLFGSLDDTQRSKLQSELKKKVKLKKLMANITAGLGSVFVAVADKYLKVGGRLAFVLPASLISGEAWGITRKLLAERYHLETVIISHDAERPNFSENTDLSEVMFIARKLKKNELSGETEYVNLWKNPRSIHEALDLAGRIIAESKKDSSKKYYITNSTGKLLGQGVKLLATPGESIWKGAQFAQADLLQVCLDLDKGVLNLPDTRQSFHIPLARLAKFGELGPDRKRVHEGFRTDVKSWTQYPAFWNHDAKAVKTISQNPNTYLTVLEDSPRGRDYGPRLLWPRAGNILLVEKLWTITHKLIAIGLPENVLANTWWPFKSSLNNNCQKCLLLWLNSSLNLLLVFGRRTVTRSAWMQIKQPAWQEMPVVDVSALSNEQIGLFASAYDAFCDNELLPLAQLNVDPTRKSIDDSICSALGLPDLSILREMLAREPGLTGKPIN